MTYSPFTALQKLTAAELNSVAGFKASKVYLTSGTFTSTDLGGKATIRVRAWGPGGGGGGCVSGVTTTSNTAAGGGGGGGYAEAIIDASTLTLPVTVTIGTGGAGGASGSNPGASGSVNSSFGTVVVAGPGLGGQASPATGTAAGILVLSLGGGAGVTGDLKVQGSWGGPAMRLLGTSGTGVIGGAGGSAGQGGGSNQPSFNGAGAAGSFPGGGGGGAASATTSSPFAGGAGGNGLVIVEFI